MISITAISAKLFLFNAASKSGLMLELIAVVALVLIGSDKLNKVICSNFG